MEQLALFTPEIVRKAGLKEAHSFPFVSQGKSQGAWGATYRVPNQAAWQYPEIELRTPNSKPVLVLDCDNGSRDPVAAGYAGALPFPSWVCRRPGTQSCHAAYCLIDPVLTDASMRPAPQAAYARVSEFFTRELRADPRYNGVLTHNPIHQQWETEWGHQGGYSLEELGQFIPSAWPMPTREKMLSCEGRNSSLFLSAMRWAGQPRHWGDWSGLCDFLHASNCLFPDPLGQREVQGIAKSVWGYQQRNLASGRQQRGLSRIQSYRGRLGKDKTKKGTQRASLLPEQGTNEALKPWEAEGISRRTWYRRKKRGT